MERFDLVVIGSGPAGEKGAAQAAYFGKRVALVEREAHLGGAGINTGTVPSKTLRETALYFSGLRQRGLYGIDYSIKKDITVPDFMYREQEVVQALREQVGANLERHRIELVRGSASFADAQTVRVATADGERLLTAAVILVATGSAPSWPADVPHAPDRLYDSDSILRMDTLPASMAVIGAGVIGCEYATTFRALGIDVTLVASQDRLLPFLDHEIGDRLRLQMQLLGLRVMLGDSLRSLTLEPSEIVVCLKSGAELRVEDVLFATGRMGATASLRLENAGLEATPRGHLTVNERFQTAVPHIYAAGDVIGFPALAATSMEQARVAMCHAFDLKYKTGVSPLLPMAVYTIPEIAAVGETEETAKERGIDYCVGRALYRGNARGQITGDLSGLVKLVFARGDLKLLGVHVLGEMASELIHVGQACLRFGGTIEYFIDEVFNHPTLGEAYKYAAYDGLGARASS
ncbi:MAG TPA: Si-specific NAD(P)(+) transhydrogenase [Vicinamibacteria bacterium]|nr:Si-specific NAD(P)(+) transhydrogenase [Vicinamibacteria bacterium]